MLIMCILAIRGLNVFRKLLKGGTKWSKKNNAAVFKSVCIRITTGNCEVLRFWEIPSHPPSLIPLGWAGARESAQVTSPVFLGQADGNIGAGVKSSKSAPISWLIAFKVLKHLKHFPLKSRGREWPWRLNVHLSKGPTSLASYTLCLIIIILTTSTPVRKMEVLGCSGHSLTVSRHNAG